MAFTDFKAPSGQPNKGLGWRELDEYLLVAAFLSVLSSSMGEWRQQLQGLDMTDAIVDSITCDMR